MNTYSDKNFRLAEMQNLFKMCQKQYVRNKAVEFVGYAWDLACDKTGHGSEKMCNEDTGWTSSC